MGLLDRIAARTVDRPVERRFAVDQWISDYLLPANEFGFNGHTYPFGLNQTYYLGDKSREISTTLPGYMAAIRSCPPAFGAQLVRASVLSQARFCFRNADWSPKAGRQFTTSALQPLQKPWTNATTGQLINVLEWHEGLAGNAYVTSRTPGRLRVLRPDWVVIVYGSDQQPEDAAHALDGELIGYGYCNGGIQQGKYRLETLLPGEVAHWSPLPDPECAGIGMSWITPAIREIQGDRAATDHKLQFFANGATPNMVVKGLTAATKEQFDEIVDALESRHAGVRNAYRTLYLTAGADATVVGADLKQIDFKATQGAGETRISMLSRVHPVILGASEGLQGSSLNAGNFGAARRVWADTWIYPTLADLAASLSPMVRVPADAELWAKTSDMPILREDAKDAAEIEQTKAATIVSLTGAGFTRGSAIAAVMAQDMTLLEEDPDWVSVQLQQAAGKTPTPTGPGPVAGGAGPKAPARRRLPESRKFNPLQPRDPGGEDGGQWTKSPAGAAEAAAKDLLKLAGKIDLAPDEKLVGSAKLDADRGGARLALTDLNGKRMLRLGLGSEGYGRRNRDEGVPAWDGNPSPKPLSKAERDHLIAEDDDLIAEYDTASPARQEQIDNRQEAIRELLTADDIGFNGTANLDQYSTKRLIDRIGPALDEAVDQETAENAAWDELEALEAKGNPDPVRLAKLREITGRGGAGHITFVEGIVPGSDWGDVHFRVELDDLSVGPQVIVGVMPKGAPDDWGDDKDWEGTFDTAEARKLLRLLGKFSS